MSDGLDPRDYVHPETGEIYVPKEDLQNAEKDLVKARARIRAYERREQDTRLEDPNRVSILMAIDRWKLVTNHPKANVKATDRFDLVRARRREGYPFDAEDEPSIFLAIDGIGAYPYATGPGERSRTGPPSQRHDRLGICLGCGENLERFSRLGWRARYNGGVPNLSDANGTMGNPTAKED